MTYRNLITACVSVFLLSVMTTCCQAGIAYSDVTVDQQSAWTGFSADFQPVWQGDTKVVEIVEPIGNPITATTGCFLSCSGCDWSVSYLQKEWTVERISSSANTRVNTTAEILLDADLIKAAKNTSGSGKTANTDAIANYAEIITTTGKPLANGSAIAYQNASFTDHDAISAKGRVSAGSMIVDGIDDLSATALGESCFNAVYQFKEATGFSLNLDLASLGEADMEFTITDVATNEIVMAMGASDGVRSEFAMTGILEEGQYCFDLASSTDSSIDSTGQKDAGGMALYDIALEFDARERTISQPTHDNSWGIPSLSLCGLSLVQSTTDEDLNAVPEPSTFVLAGLAVVGLLVLRRQSRRR